MKSTPAERCLARSADQIELWVDREGDLRLQHPHPTIPNSFLIQPLAGRKLGWFLTGLPWPKNIVLRLDRPKPTNLPDIVSSSLWVVSFYERPVVAFSVEALTTDQAVDILNAIPNLPAISVGETLCVLPTTLLRQETAGCN